MNDPHLFEAVRARMGQLRCEIDDEIEGVAASAHTMLDWKHYARTYPWACLGGAMALGIVIAPRRSRAIRPDLTTLTELAKSGRFVITPTATRGLTDALLAAAANIAMRKATAYLGRIAERLLRIMG